MDGKNRIADRIAVYGILILLLAGGIAAFVFSRDFSERRNDTWRRHLPGSP